MTTELLKALLVGICAAVPVGPVLMLVIQKTLSSGRAAGLITGLGSAVADTIYAAVGFFTLSVIQDFVDRNQAFIMIAGGVLIAIIGITMFRKRIAFDPAVPVRTPGKLPLLSYALQSMVSVFSNPVAIAVMMALLASFSLASDTISSPAILIILFVGFGELLYWWVVTLLLNKFLKLNEKSLNILSKAASVVIIAFAVYLAAKGTIMIV